METKIIFVDLDLTLLKSDATISDYTVSILEKCKEKGILIGFCTSRGTTRIQRYKDIVNPDIEICNAGGCIYYKGELIHAESFTLEETKVLLARTYDVVGEDAEITVDTLNDFFWNRTTNKSTQYMPEAKFNDCKNFNEPAMKFCVQLSDAENAELISNSIGNCTAIAFSDIPWYKFAPKTATKENGIKFLSKYLNIPLSNMISFGDDYSDIGMLKTTGKGIAMGNAIPEVKEIASEITLSCDEDGVASYLEKNVL